MPNHLFWWLWSECSPLPIPNREVKPHIADDTALVCGKVSVEEYNKQVLSSLLILYERTYTDRGPFEG